MSDNKTSQKLERVYCDVIGPVSPSSISGNRYAISFIDEISGYAVVKFMKSKNASIANFQRVCCCCPKMADQKFCELIIEQNTKTKPLKTFA